MTRLNGRMDDLHEQKNGNRSLCGLGRVSRCFPRNWPGTYARPHT